MPQEMREFTKVDATYLTSAAVRFTVSRRIPCSADALFRSFEDPVV